MDKRIVIPRIVVRPILPPPLEIGARIRPQWLHWQVGRYREKLSFGPGGRGKADVWVPEREGEQHNMILNALYDFIIGNYGFLGASQYAAVGTGSRAPEPIQGHLEHEIAIPVTDPNGNVTMMPLRTNTTPAGEPNGIESQLNPGEYIIRRVLEFSEDKVGGYNLTEWGFSPMGSYNGILMTRELFRDSSGNPIVLTLALDQRLRLIYRYKVTVSPTSVQNVSVNIGGDGPGVRTAKFLLTGRFSTADTSPNTVTYSNISLNSSTEPERKGDLLVVDAMARGDFLNGVGRVGLFTTATPLTYIHSTSRQTANFTKTPTFDSPVGRSRRMSLLLDPSEAIMTIKSVSINGNASTGINTYFCPTLNLVFDDGQEFTKDNLHKLLIAYWQITWGP
jgi:hypothetical protein